MSNPTIPSAWNHGVPIRMLEKHASFFPKRFALDGTEYIVKHINNCHTTTSSKPVYVFRVVCEDGNLFDVLQHSISREWRACGLGKEAT